MNIKLTRRIGSILLAVYLILVGLTAFGLNFPNEPTILGILAIAAGIFILIER